MCSEYNHYTFINKEILSCNSNKNWERKKRGIGTIK